MAEAGLGAVCLAALLDRRLAPLGNTFVHETEDTQAQFLRDAHGAARRRSSSYAGYVPFVREKTWQGQVVPSCSQEQTVPSCSPEDLDGSEAAAPLSVEPVRLLQSNLAMFNEPTRDFDAPQLVPLELWSDTNSDFEDDGNEFDAVYQPAPVQHEYGMPKLPALTLTSPPTLFVVGADLANRTTSGSVISLSDAMDSGEQHLQWSSENIMPAQVPAFNVPEQPRHMEAPPPSTAAPDPITTLMIRNLPRSLTQAQLIAELDRSGLEGLYDFAYMPRCFQSGGNNGFAFVNLTSPAAAGHLVGVWHRQRLFGLGPSDAVLNLSPAVLQGFEANVAKWDAPRSRRIRNPDYVPFVAKNDRHVRQQRTRAPRLSVDMPPAKRHSESSMAPAGERPHANGWRSTATAAASTKRGQLQQQLQQPRQTQQQKQQPIPVRTTPAGMPAPAPLSRNRNRRPRGNRAE